MHRSGNKFPTIAVAVFTILFLGGPLGRASYQGITGTWKTIDDKTGKEKSIVEIYLQNGTAAGRILRVLDKPNGGLGLKCDQCRDEQKNRPMIGLQILTGMTLKGNQWSGGTILDPENGKTYRCKIELSADGNNLKVRGFIGISLLGRTQVWHRVKATP